MPPILTYVFEDAGFVGSRASVFTFLLVWHVRVLEVGKALNVELTNVVWPLEFDGEIFVAHVVGLDGFYDCDGGYVLDEDYGSRSSQIGRVVYDC